MKHTSFLAFCIAIVLAGCSSNYDICEDITLASEQIQQCQALHRQIINTKGKPLIRTELERRYQQDCIDIRYYRDEKQSAICGNKHRVEEIIKSAKQEASSNEYDRRE
ncbi:MAG TPA: hypothetical protein DE042_03945 [Colwellia sp.]|nr:hypothetical protein [Colwellia sp.]